MAILEWSLQGLLALMFIIAGTGKTVGLKMHKDNFIKWDYPQWFRVVTGVIELGAAVLLIVGFWNNSAAVIGAAILVVVGIGGVYTHIRIKDTMKDTVTIAVLGILALILFIILL